MRLTPHLTVLALAATLLAAPLAARAAEPPPNLWREMYLQDLAFARETVAAKYIYARTPAGPAWDRLYADANRQAQDDAAKVNDFAGYSAALRRYSEAFADAHLRVRLDLQPARLAWPRFLVRYESGRYVVVESAMPAVAKGSAITACDGKPIEALVAERASPLARAGGAGQLLESGRDAVARTLFVDAKSPFAPRPARCRIGDADIDLAWTPIPADQLAKLNAPHDLLRDPVTAVTPFGRNNVRIRMATFAPSSIEEAKQFHAVIDAAPTLRDKDIVVLDVRGNGGGTYNWFTGFLEAFYGTDYADHYATARLKIVPVFTDPPGGGAARPAPASAAPNAAPRKDPFDTPPDRPMDGLLQGFVARQAAGGTTVYAVKLGSLPPAALRPPPPSPVKARVYVLTDYGCGSACISFLDELHRFPGVVQVGRETGVDSRSATPLTYPLPSGNGELSVPSLVREGRERGDNIPWRPDIRYDGDIADTDAVLAWIEKLPAKPTR